MIKLQTLDNPPISKKLRYFTTAALKDELTRQLSSAAVYNVNPDILHIEINYKYHEYAHKLLHYINLTKPVSVFEIKLSDLSQELVHELQLLHPETLNEVIIDAISRLYESIDFKYFHESGVRGKIRWKFV